MTWTTAAIVGGVLAYPVTVGLAARLWVWLLGWDIAHDPEWKQSTSGTLGCGHYIHGVAGGYTLRCPGCDHRDRMWALSIAWPLMLPVGALMLTASRTARFTVRTARAVGPKTYTGDDR